MVKTPRTRHSKPRRDPVTIDLEANEPRPVDAEPAASGAETIEATQTYRAASGMSSAEPAAEPAIEHPVEDRIEEEAATTGRPSTFETPKRNDTPPPTSSGGNWGSHLAAGVAGGVLAALAAWLIPSGNDNSALDAVRTQVSGLSTEIDGLKASNQNATELANALELVRSDVAALQSAVQADGGDASALASLNDKVAQLEQTIASVSASSQTSELEPRIAAVEQSVSGLTSRLEATASQPKIALSIAAAALRSALERGEPFTAELETFAAIAPNAAQIEPLRAHAATGVVPRADIAKAFPAAADAMVAAANPVDQNAGFFQRLLNSAESVVQVRPVGEQAGDDAGARVARMEVAVNGGDYQKAIAEYDALPDAVKAAGAAIAEQIRARAAVEQLTDQMIADAMKAA